MTQRRPERLPFTAVNGCPKNAQLGALAAEADFTTGLLTVTLKNLLSPTTSNFNAGQTISDLSFTLSNNAGTLGSATASGELANVGSTGTVSAPVSDNPVRWLGQGPPPPGGSGTPIKVNGATVTLEVLGGGQPSELILTFPMPTPRLRAGSSTRFSSAPAPSPCRCRASLRRPRSTSQRFHSGPGRITLSPFRDQSLVQGCRALSLPARFSPWRAADVSSSSEPPFPIIDDELASVLAGQHAVL
jgi:hypothetical protein